MMTIRYVFKLFEDVDFTVHGEPVEPSFDKLRTNAIISKTCNLNGHGYISISQILFPSSSRTRGAMGSESSCYRWIPAFAGMTNVVKQGMTSLVKQGMMTIVMRGVMCRKLGIFWIRIESLIKRVEMNHAI